MIKNVKWIFVVLIISSLISFSFVGKNTPTEGLTIGDKAPTFTICGEKQLIDLKDLRGKYVLLSFWASFVKDAECYFESCHRAGRQCRNGFRFI